MNSLSDRELLQFLWKVSFFSGVIATLIDLYILSEVSDRLESFGIKLPLKMYFSSEYVFIIWRTVKHLSDELSDEKLIRLYRIGYCLLYLRVLFFLLFPIFLVWWSLLN
jgi:hypothetical protein